MNPVLAGAIVRRHTEDIAESVRHGPRRRVDRIPRARAPVAVRVRRQLGAMLLDLGVHLLVAT
ncbi:MAG: hypothetical protein ACRDL8_08745 [Solirubrobacteraceae bacterium]